MKKIKKNPKLRSDARRNVIIRFAKKIPHIILKLVEPKSKYKTSTERFFTEAYLNAFIRFWQVVSVKGQNDFLKSLELKYSTPGWYMDSEDNDFFEPTFENYSHLPDEFYQFISIFFPKRKLDAYVNVLCRENDGSTLSQVSSLVPYSMVCNGAKIMKYTMIYRKATSKDMALKFIKSNRVYYECIKLILSLGKGGNMTKEVENELMEFIYHPLEKSMN